MTVSRAAGRTNRLLPLKSNFMSKSQTNKRAILYSFAIYLLIRKSLLHLPRLLGMLQRNLITRSLQQIAFSGITESPVQGAFLPPAHSHPLNSVTKSRKNVQTPVGETEQGASTSEAMGAISLGAPMEARPSGALGMGHQRDTKAFHHFGQCCSPAMQPLGG